MGEISALRGLLLRDRSIRRFDQQSVSVEMLMDLVDLTRYCASGRNAQPLVYAVVNQKSLLDAVFPALKWAGYYEDWDGPSVGERPMAYIIQALDTEIVTNPLCDDGLQLQAITLGATAYGLGACIIKSFDTTVIREVFGLSDNIKPLYVLALGYPAEKSVIVDQKGRDDIRYYRDGDDMQCVPKRPLKDIILSVNNHGI